MENNEITENEVKDFCWSFCAFGYLDVEEALRVIKKTGFEQSDLIENIEEYMNDCEITDIRKIDPVAHAYDMIFESARYFIEQITDIDITDHGFYSYGDGVASFFDGHSDSFRKYISDLSGEKKQKLRDHKPTNFFFVNCDMISALED